jgi:uncharacterized protein GlcG (DUF336 family)
MEVRELMRWGQKFWRVGWLVGVVAASVGVGDWVGDAAVQRKEKKGARKQPLAAVVLRAPEVESVLRAAAAAVDDNTMSVAVADRTGQILGVFRKPSSDADTDEVAVGLARTAAFFSHNQAPLSSRTVHQISGIHFPPDVRFSPQSDLFGIELTNRGCALSPDLEAIGFEPPRSIGGTTSLGIVTGRDYSGRITGIGFADLIDALQDSDRHLVHPGGVPIYKNGEMVGGVGVAFADPTVPGEFAEFAAFTGSNAFVNSGIGFFINEEEFGTSFLSEVVVFVGGISLPFVNQMTRPVGSAAGLPIGSFIVMPRDGRAAREGWLLGPMAGNGLTKADVRRIVNQAKATAEHTRAVIRLPIGSRVRMVIAVGDRDGNLLGVFRQPDSTIFSVDVACVKARNAYYFSTLAGNMELNAFSNGEFPLRADGRAWAVNARTLNFGAQPLFPTGIDGSEPGPFFDLFQFDADNPCTQGMGAFPRKSGIVFFPGSAPLYKNGTLVGGLGISGDGVDQDDYVTAGGVRGFEPPKELRADNLKIRGIRLPYFKFPRNPEG